IEHVVQDHATGVEAGRRDEKQCQGTEFWLNVAANCRRQTHRHGESGKDIRPGSDDVSGPCERQPRTKAAASSLGASVELHRLLDRQAAAVAYDLPDHRLPTAPEHGIPVVELTLVDGKRVQPVALVNLPTRTVCIERVLIAHLMD